MTDNGDLRSSNQNNPAKSAEAQCNRHNSSYEDEDSFFDAVDSLKNIQGESSRKNSSVFIPNSAESHDHKSGHLFRFDKEMIESTEDEEDADSKTLFYDTATSRHTSELNEASLDENKTEDTNDANKTISDGEEDDDEQDAELETAWSFWIDRLDLFSFDSNTKPSII